MKKIVTPGELLEMEWKAEPCHVGYSCWCRVIEPVEECYFDETTEAYIVPSGSLDTETADHIVRLHNDSLKPAQNKKLNAT